MQMSEHFTLEELTTSQTAVRKGIDNAPPQWVFWNLCKLCATLERVRALVNAPVIISSGYRCPELNAAIGGAKNSAHMMGLAADINVPGYTPRLLAFKIKQSGIPFDQLILEFGSWVHIGIADKPRMQLLTIERGTGYQEGIV